MLIVLVISYLINPSIYLSLYLFIYNVFKVRLSPRKEHFSKLICITIVAAVSIKLMLNFPKSLWCDFFLTAMYIMCVGTILHIKSFKKLAICMVSSNVAHFSNFSFCLLHRTDPKIYKIK